MSCRETRLGSSRWEEIDWCVEELGSIRYGCVALLIFRDECDGLTVGSMCAANLVLQNTIERLYAGNLYADIPRGVFVVRGENVLLLGEIV